MTAKTDQDRPVPIGISRDTLALGRVIDHDCQACKYHVTYKLVYIGPLAR